eukprot:4740868-Pleurochrysis_carterae.AAC.1
MVKNKHYNDCGCLSSNTTACWFTRQSEQGCIWIQKAKAKLMSMADAACTNCFVDLAWSER